MSESLPMTPGSDRARVLIICDFFLPGRKAGGGVWTIINLIERLGDSYEFFVITRNHDGRSDRMPYSGIDHKDWNEIGGAKVFYLSSRSITARKLAELSESISPAAVYLNSVFSELVVRYILARRLGMVQKRPVLLAPIGNLAPGALRFKGRKKRFYLAVARSVGLYRDVLWKASSAIEKDEIKRVIGKRARTAIAPDLSPRSVLPDYSADKKPPKIPGNVKFLYYSRIDAKKNLGFLLDCLKSLVVEEVQLKIAGAVDDEQYWAECRNKIAELPINIKVEIAGVVSYDVGLKLLIDSHFFILPTLGENFGYVFLEALAAGCGLLITEHTMWGAVDKGQAGWVIPLESKDEWISTLQGCVKMDQENYAAISGRAREMAIGWLNNSEPEAMTRALFRSALTPS